jgi:hypothetical protein
MKKLSIFLAASLFICNICFATIRRVGYPGIQLADVDYTTLQQANDAASNNDTIQVYGSPGGGTISKKLVIIGYGYNFDIHSNLQAIGGDIPSYLNNLSFGAGSDGSKVTGLQAYFYIGDQSGSHAMVSDITFERCNGYFYFNQYEGYGPESNIKILSSVIQGGGMQWNSINDFPVTNIQVYNCIINNFNLWKASTSAAFINCVGQSSNTYGWYSYLNLNDAGCLVKNCILYYSQASINVNTVYESNFFAEAQPIPVIPGSNNRWSQDWGSIFNRLGGNSDQPALFVAPEFDEDYYTLKPGSPAINGGFNAANQPTDCGIFGGEAAYKYKLSGVPAVPAIYKLTAPSLNASSNPYNVTISVRSNN